VVGKLAELFISHELQGAASAIKSKADRKDTRYALTRQMNLYRAELTTTPTLSLNTRLGCMTVVAAKLLPDDMDCTSAYLPKTLAAESEGQPPEEWNTSRPDDSVENQLRRANVCVNGQARAVYEGRFEFSQDRTAYRLSNAGYRINALLTTDDKSAVRTALYTLNISQPGRTEQGEVLSSTWVGLGTVAAGARSRGASSENAPWMRVPALSDDARRVYEEKTKIHQQVSGEIDALNRALAHNQRLLAGLDQRIATANADAAEGLRQERTKVTVQMATESAELDARKAEYQDLPHAVLELMPVTVEVAVTETETEKKAQMALAALIGSSNTEVAASIGNATTGLVSKSLATEALKADTDPESPQAQLQAARERYFDAWVAVHAGTMGDARAPRQLAAARRAYNAARRRLGLGPIH
jgi:hypothetical protein